MYYDREVLTRSSYDRDPENDVSLGAFGPFRALERLELDGFLHLRPRADLLCQATMSRLVSLECHYSFLAGSFDAGIGRVYEEQIKLTLRLDLLLPAVPSLQRLVLRRYDDEAVHVPLFVDDDHLDKIGRALPDLRELYFPNWGFSDSYPTDTGLLLLSQRCPKLFRLEAGDLSCPTDTAIVKRLRRRIQG